jgi:TPR repeat protein
MSGDLELARQQYDLAHEMLKKGDYESAIAYVRQSADNGFVFAQNDLAYHFLNIEKKPSMSMRWLKKVFDNPNYDPSQVDEFVPKEVCYEYCRILDENIHLKELLQERK